MSGRLPANVLSLERFMLRNDVLNLYRQILRTIRHLPSKAQRKELQEWAREDFDKNKHLTNEEDIKMMITRGKLSLKELESAVHMSK